MSPEPVQAGVQANIAGGWAILSTQEFRAPDVLPVRVLALDAPIPTPPTPVPMLSADSESHSWFTALLP